MRIQATLLAAMLLGVPGLAAGQSVRGVVVEKESGVPVSEARVELQVPGRAVVLATTDSIGVFRLTVPRAGRFALRVTHVAYRPMTTDSVDIGAGENIAIEIHLSTSPIALAPVVVTSNSRARASGFYDRMRTHGSGRFLTRTDLDARGGARVTDLLVTLPGVTIRRVSRGGRRGGPTSNLIAMRGGMTTNCEPAIYIDGTQVRQMPESPLDDLISVDIIDGIEAYPANAGAPAQFADPGKCGVLLIWTRIGQNDGGAALTLKRALIAAGAITAILLLMR